MTIEMKEIGHAAQSATTAGYGDHFTYEITVNLPTVAESDKFDMNLELFSVQPTTSTQEIYNILTLGL